MERLQVRLTCSKVVLVNFSLDLSLYSRFYLLDSSFSNLWKFFGFY